MTTLAARHAASHRDAPLLVFDPKPITRCNCPVRGGLIQHRAGPDFCAVVAERRLALHKFWFDESRQRVQTAALRRFARLARFWAFLRSMLGFPPKENDHG